MARQRLFLRNSLCGGQIRNPAWIDANQTEDRSIS
jgi:hypothetical protein